MTTRRWVPPVLGALLAAAVLAVVLLVRQSEETPPRSSVTATEPGVQHVHGLGIDPADRTLYVATHNGMFRVPEHGRAERIGVSYQDTMGFTVAGPHRFLGSGHPDVPAMVAGAPSLLGLIESRDAGKTWRPLSLSGEADFHAMAFAHGRVYGWDSTSGRLLVSDDMETWAERSTLPLTSFAVDPGSPEHLVASGETGLLESTDGGRAWSTLTGLPPAALSWDAATGLWAAGADGILRRSVGGRDFSAVGQLPGAPQVLLATGSELFLAAHDAAERTTIYRSTDEGATWRPRYRDSRR